VQHIVGEKKGRGAPERWLVVAGAGLVVLGTGTSLGARVYDWLAFVARVTGLLHIF
jgi:hypothetical protein